MELSINTQVPCDENLKKDLDPEQLKAVCAPLTNTCVFAIAGSGKTRVLTYRVANLINNGIKENSMLLLTFTNKAADEMITRIKKLLNKSRLSLTAGTFHSVASLFLRKYAKEIGYTKGFDILDSKSQKNLIKNCRDYYVVNYKVNDSEFPSHNVLTEIYSGAINHNLSFVDFIKKYYPYIKGVTVDAILLIFQDYVDRKETTNCMDFDDLLLNFLDLLQNKSIQKEITDHFKYVFVDEYQDINWIQYEILELLNKGNDNMFVIGDSNQCIYQFRGSNDKYIDLFEKTHENVNKFHLTYNYRSTPQILNLAESSINNNDLNYTVELHTKNPDSSKPFVFGTQEKDKQIEYIAKDILKYHSKELNNVAILVRKGAEIERIKEILSKEGITSKIKGGNSLLQTKHFNDIYNILSSLENPANEVAFKHTLGLFNIYKTNVDKIYSNLKQNKFNLNKYSLTLAPQANSAMSLLISLKNAPYKNVSEKIRQISDMFYTKYIHTKFANADEIDEDIRYLMISSERFKEINQFIDFYLLERCKERETSSKSSITIITMHKAKGLEWDYVYIPNMNKSEFPRSKEKDINDNTEQVQNERKLFYVATTRAKKELVISYSMELEDGKEIGPSVFLEELEPDTFDHDFY